MALNILKWIFQFVFGVTVLFAIFSAFTVGKQLWGHSYCGSIECLEFFVDSCRIPLSTLGVLGTLMALYYASIKYQQNILEQSKANYNEWRNTFLALRNENKYEYQVLSIGDNALFLALYPRKEDFSYDLNSEFKKNILDDYVYNCFCGFMDTIDKLTNSRDDKNKYYYESYTAWAGLYGDIDKILPLIKLPSKPVYGFGDMGRPLFTTKYRNKFEGFIRDLLSIALTVNLMEGNKHLTNDVGSRWQRVLDNLESVSKVADQIKRYLDESNITERLTKKHWAGGAEDTDFTLPPLPSELIKDDAARYLIYDYVMNSSIAPIFSDAAPKMLADALDIKEPPH